MAIVGDLWPVAPCLQVANATTTLHTLSGQMTQLSEALGLLSQHATRERSAAQFHARRPMAAGGFTSVLLGYRIMSPWHSSEQQLLPNSYLTPCLFRPSHPPCKCRSPCILPLPLSRSCPPCAPKHVDSCAAQCCGPATLQPARVASVLAAAASAHWQLQSRP
jgi:hypothetical protein